jgi:SsrA-binding protein
VTISIFLSCYVTQVPKEKARPGETLIVRNKRASFDYELGDRFEAGIVLKGSEVKMLRAGKADLTDSFCTVFRGEAFLQGVSIAAMDGAAFAHAPKGARKLLLHHREILLVGLAIAREGMTAVATRLYFKGGRVKVEIALARGKKIYDKRETIKAQDAEREARAHPRSVVHGQRRYGPA